MTTFTATRDGDQITIKGDTWSDTFHVDKLESWIRFYETQLKKIPIAQGYRTALEALKGVR